MKHIFKYKGRRCIVMRTEIGNYCAYVETTVRIGLSVGDPSPEEGVSCHGGVTFSGTMQGEGDVWFFGMDFAHYGDKFKLILPNSNMKLTSFSEGHRWTFLEVVKETKKMCVEVLKYEVQVQGKTQTQGSV